MNFVKYFYIVILTLILTSCAPPTEVVEEASLYLNGNCRALFLDTGMYKYQHLAHAIGGKAVFALSDNKSGQYCAYATNNNRDVKERSFEGTSWEKLELVAIARCEASKPSMSTTSPCKIFARNNEIVWRKTSKPNLD